MPVYVIRAGDTDLVKIGLCMGDLTQRICSMQTDNHEKLSLLRVVEGNDVTERRFQLHFWEQRVRGQWFRFVPEMLTISVDELQPESRLPMSPERRAIISAGWVKRKQRQQAISPTQ